MNKNEMQFEVIPPSVIFLSATYRVYIDLVRKMYLLNIKAVEELIALSSPSLYEIQEIRDRLIRFHFLCVDLMNQDCQHGYYRPDLLDIRRLLSWIQVTGGMIEKLSQKTIEFSDEGAYYEN
ncbi:hypothetical protein FXQ12_24490 [Salmonella enterica]|nr:hypothetical protein [Salmonella enterica]ECC9415162.1 hypothetical protein [Salmonella enterica subsp. enterica]EHF1448727.1 hypothetical protein [Salmonella enterica subsp. enterica serovar 4,5,12:b:-]EHG1528839.1 hypothetical protein [Salmonella enterica subsp. enterica serovar 4,[5],12:b:-]ECD8848873.1 hypothetical protein [Salmonella enterica subsp. enterica]